MATKKKTGEAEVGPWEGADVLRRMARAMREVDPRAWPSVPIPPPPGGGDG